MKKKMVLAIGLVCSMALFGCQSKPVMQENPAGNTVIEEVSIETGESSIEDTQGAESEEETTESMFICDNSKINELAEKVIVLGENEEIEDQSWVAFNFCYRVSIGYVEPPQGTYKHKKDYFLFTGAVIPYFEVEYTKDDEDPDKRRVYDACDFHVVQEDVTFDGNDDILISLGHAGAQGAEVYCAYIFDEENEKYVYAPSFEEISNYKVNQKEKEILSFSRSDAANDNNAVYSYFKPENSFQKVAEYYGKEVAFEGGDNEFTEVIDAENDLYTLVVDLDRDGVEEAIVCEALTLGDQGSELYNADEEGCYYADKIYFVDETKTPHLLEKTEGPYLLKHQYLLTQDKMAYITLSAKGGMVDTGAIYTVDADQVVNVTKDLSQWGRKYFSSEDEIVWQKEDPLAYYKISEGMSFLETGGIGYCKLPYHYKLDGTNICGYQAKVVSLEEVQAMAPFDNTKFEAADAVEYIYRENGELYVNRATKSNENDMIIAYDFDVETYKLIENQWVFARRDQGYYNEDPLRAPKWDILTRVNK